MLRSSFPVVALLVFAATAAAQNTTSTPAPRALIGNGGFESGFRRENLWDGVDATGYLTGERGALPVLTAAGAIAETSMPISVSVADMNRDGKPDLVTMDVLGYCRIYFNAGTPNEPKFTVGDLANFFLTRISPLDPLAADVGNAPSMRRGPRAHATEMFRSGKRDLVIGNYMGEVLAIPNAGSAQAPDFRQPPDVAKSAIPTTANATQFWGNMFSPATWDWNGDGREDLLLGEGSYSANNIHLLLNTGGGSRPVFEESNRHVLAFGDGLEQLSPAVVDYNGDGLPDLLVSERTGRVALYLNKGTPWNSGEKAPELPFASFVNAGAGSPLSFGGICVLSTGDLDGNGLFDIVAGKANGRIAVAYNKGSKTEPKFDAPVELRGDAGTPPMNLPSGWEVDFGIERGNFLAVVNIVKAAEDQNLMPPEGAAALRAAYAPSHNRVMPPPSYYGAALGNFNPLTARERDIRIAPARFFQLRQAGRFRLENGAQYTLSIKTRGRALDGAVILEYVGQKELSADRITRGDRDTVVRQEQIAREDKKVVLRFSPGPAWAEASQDFRVSFSNRDLADLKETNSASLAIRFTLPQGGELFLDDIRLTKK